MASLKSIRCAGKLGKNRKVTITCMVSLKQAAHTTIALAVRRGTKLFATGHRNIRARTSTVTLKTVRHLTRGGYRVRVSVSSAGQSRTLTVMLRLK